MDSIVHEIVVGALIMGLVLSVIIIFRQSMDTVKEGNSQQNKIENINSVSMIGVNGGIYPAAKIKEALTYADIADMDVGVVVQESPGNSKRLTDVNTDKDYLNQLIYVGANYLLEIDYYNEKYEIMKASGTIPDHLCSSNDLNVKYVEFYFVRQ